jgi:hypothetical protein
MGTTHILGMDHVSSLLISNLLSTNEALSLLDSLHMDSVHTD